MGKTGATGRLGERRIKMKSFKVGATRILVLATVLACVPALSLGDATPLSAPAPSLTPLESQVRHSLVMLPYYGVFDHIEFQVQGDRVILSGQVAWPTLKDDAQNALLPIAGVKHVTNDIQVLPLSPFDNAIRFREYRAIFRSSSLYQYAMGPNPSIHIIVDNGHVTLYGVVANKMDSQIAYLAANTVPGVFSVTNNLRID
jgi:BON domain